MSAVETTLAAAYAASGLIACGLYLPQLRTLAASAAARRAMSLTSWCGWLALSWIAVAYAGLVLRDGPMMLVTGLNSALQVVVVALALWQRAVDRHGRSPATATPGPADRRPATAPAD